MKPLRTLILAALLAALAAAAACGRAPTALEAAARRARQAVERCEEAYRTVYDDSLRGGTSAAALAQAKDIYLAAMGDAAALGMALSLARAADDQALADVEAAQAIARHSAAIDLAAARILAVKGGR